LIFWNQESRLQEPRQNQDCKNQDRIRIARTKTESGLQEPRAKTLRSRGVARKALLHGKKPVIVKLLWILVQKKFEVLCKYLLWNPLTGFGVYVVARFSIDIDALRVGCKKYDLG
jgi:hypothetical protein